MNLKEEDKVAARVFLQRSEVRLSTLQRIAGSFISGAGLLILVPYFLKDLVDNLLSLFFIFKKEYDAIIPFLDTKPEDILLYLKTEMINLPFIGIILCVVFPFCVFVYISIKSIANLYEDIVRFYYIPNDFPKTQAESGFHLPRLSITGLRLPEDETTKDFTEKLAETHRHFIDQGFVIPTNLNDEEFKSVLALIDETKGRVAGRDSFDLDDYLNIKFNEDANWKSKNAEDKKNYEREIRKEKFENLLEVIYKTFENLSNSKSITLLQEVAKMEASLVRHIYFTRRLVIRYVKSILTLTCLTIFLMLLSSYIRSKVNIYNSHPADFISIENALKTIGLIQIMIFTAIYYCVTRPISWLRHFIDMGFEPIDESSPMQRMAKDYQLKIWRDPQLLKFEQSLQFICLITSMIIVLGISILFDSSVISMFVIVFLFQFFSFGVIKTMTEYGRENLWNGGFLFNEMRRMLKQMLSKIMPFIKLTEDPVSNSIETFFNLEKNK